MSKSRKNKGWINKTVGIGNLGNLMKAVKTVSKVGNIKKSKSSFNLQFGSSFNKGSSSRSGCNCESDVMPTIINIPIPKNDV